MGRHECGSSAQMAEGGTDSGLTELHQRRSLKEKMQETEACGVFSGRACIPVLDPVLIPLYCCLQNEVVHVPLSRIRPDSSLDNYSNMCHQNIIITNVHLQASKVWLGVSLAAEGDWVWQDGKCPKLLLCSLDALAMVNTTGTDEDHAVSSIVGLDIQRKITMLD